MGGNKWIGQESFFDTLYSGQFLKMLRYAHTLICKADLAEEIVQDAFVEALIHIDELMKKERPEFWLQKTVRNKALHVKRAQARYTWRLVSLESEEIIDNFASKQFCEIDEMDSITQIRQVIAEALDSHEIHLLKRIAMDGATYKTLSNETGMSISACQKKIQRIRKKLKKKISV